MRELLDSFLANGLADFEGLQISGTIPVKTDLINAIIADFLKPEADVEPETEVLVPSALEDGAPMETHQIVMTAAATPKPKKISLQKVIRPLIKHIGVRAIEGKIVLEFDVRR